MAVIRSSCVQCPTAVLTPVVLCLQESSVLLEVTFYSLTARSILAELASGTLGSWMPMATAQAHMEFCLAELGM